MYLNQYALEKMVESRLEELRAAAARRRVLTPDDRATSAAESAGARSKGWRFAFPLSR